MKKNNKTEIIDFAEYIKKIENKFSKANIIFDENITREDILNRCSRIEFMNWDTVTSSKKDIN